MAIVPARLSLSLNDTRGNKGTFLAHAMVSDASTVAQAVTAVGALKTAFHAISDAGILDGSFTVLNRAVSVAPGEDADLSSGAVFDFSNAETASTYGSFLPSYGDGGFLPGGHIDITASPNDAWVTYLLAAVLGGNYTDTQYQVLSAGLDAFLSNRKRKRRVR